MARKKGGKNNATKHGAFARDAVLPGEDHKAIEKIHQGLIDEWTPTGPIEEEAVLSLAKHIMAKRRIDSFYKAEVQHAAQHPDEEKQDKFGELYRCLKKVKTFNDAMGIYLQLPAPWQTYLMNNAPRSSFEADEAWLEEVVAIVEALIAGAEQTLELEKRASKFQSEQAAKLYELTEKKMMLDDRIDVLIDKAIKRLIMLKTYKDVVRAEAKVIEHRPSE